MGALGSLVEKVPSLQMSASCSLQPAIPVFAQKAYETSGDGGMGGEYTIMGGFSHTDLP